MRRASLLAGVAIAAVVIWVVAASAVYCLLRGSMALFVWPFDQWIQAAPFWRVNWLMTVLVITSAIVATMVLAAGGGVAFRITRAKSRPLYGASAWASESEMLSGGIRSERSPFR